MISLILGSSNKICFKWLKMLFFKFLVAPSVPEKLLISLKIMSDVYIEACLLNQWICIFFLFHCILLIGMITCNYWWMYKISIPANRSRTGDLRISRYMPLQSSALPTELSRADVKQYIFWIFISMRTINLMTNASHQLVQHTVIRSWLPSKNKRWTMHLFCNMILTRVHMHTVMVSLVQWRSCLFVIAFYVYVIDTN